MPRDISSADYTVTEIAEKYDALMPLLIAIWHDFQELSKKKPEATLNKWKVQLVNRLLTDVLVVVDGEPSREFLDVLDEDDLPQNSDVLLILGQTVAAMKMFREKYYGYLPDRGGQGWAVRKVPAAAKKRQ